MKARQHVEVLETETGPARHHCNNNSGLLYSPPRMRISRSRTKGNPGSCPEPLAVSNYGIVTVVEFDGALSLPNESTLLTM
jgi:hypothetical protein